MTDNKHENTNPSTTCTACHEWQRDMTGTLATLQRERHTNAKLLEALSDLIKATSGYARHFHEHQYAVAVLSETADDLNGRVA